MLVLIKGAGDVASGVACCLLRAGFQVVMTEIARPTVVRQTVSFARAVDEGSAQVEGFQARLAASADEVPGLLAQGLTAVLVDPDAECLPLLRPQVLVDAIIAKYNTGTALGDAPLVIGIGPGFTAGRDCQAVVESQRGPHLGRVFWQGATAPDSGVPGLVQGYGSERVLRAPTAGLFDPLVSIGELVDKEQPLARVENQLIRAQLSGMVRGMLAPDRRVEAGQKVGDVDPRRDPALCRHISDKAQAIGMGVLTAIERYREHFRE